MSIGGIGWAIDEMRSNQLMRRRGWHGEGMWVAICEESGAKMTAPFLYMRLPNGRLIPWVASQSDLLADDWEHVR